ncbi:cam1p [Lichtheimia corymbifera JMRC:FSU:9682]|nr:cam1p [Lichtheimia corymbifera JMRC:FSU:9682]
MKWFWEHFDPQGWSIWKATYKYNDELTLVFMSNNLIGGFFARLERARKYAFASMVVTGTNNNNAISGYFIIRGQEVPYEIYDAAAYDSYDFVKIEPSQYEEKKGPCHATRSTSKYMAWEVDGIAGGKTFK